MAASLRGELSVEAAARRAEILSPLAAQDVCSRAEARAAAAALNLSERQVYNWIRRLRLARGNIAALAASSRLTTKGVTRLPQAVEDHLDRIIEEERAHAAKDDTSSLFSAVKQRGRQEMVAPPSDSTIYRRLRTRRQTSTASQSTTHHWLPPETPGILRGCPPGVPAEHLLRPLYETIGNPGGWRGFLDALSHAYGGSMSGITSYDYANRTGLSDVSTGIGRDFETSYARYYARLNPWLGAAEQRPIGLPILSDSILPYRDLLRTEFYNDWARPQTLGGGVGVTFERSGRRVMAVTVMLSRPTIEQDPEVLTRLQTLTPHILWVSQLHRQFTTLEARAAAAEGALDRLATAMVLIGATGQVIYINARAERIAAMADGVTVRQGMLDVACTREGEALRQLIGTARAGAAKPSSQRDSPPGGVMRVSRPSGRLPFEVLAAPIPDTPVRLGVRLGFSGPMVAVFIREPEARFTTPVACLRRLHGLTPAEGRLLQALLAGDTLEDIGTRFAVGRETLRSQLKSIFKKTGAASQGDLIRMGLRSLAARYGTVPPA